MIYVGYAGIIVDVFIIHILIYIYSSLILDAQLCSTFLYMRYITVYGLSFNNNCRILSAELNCIFTLIYSMNFDFSCIFYHAKNAVKISFPMPTAKNRFIFLIYSLKSMYFKNAYKEKNSRFIFGISPFFVFWTDFLKRFSLSRPLLPPLKKKVPHVSPIIALYRKSGKKSDFRCRPGNLSKFYQKYT